MCNYVEVSFFLVVQRYANNKKCQNFNVSQFYSLVSSLNHSKKEQLKHLCPNEDLYANYLSFLSYYLIFTYNETFCDPTKRYNIIKKSIFVQTKYDYEETNNCLFLIVNLL